MGRNNNERKHHTFYPAILLSIWDDQTPEFKQKCYDIGKEKGYTGINVFYYFLYQYSMTTASSYDYKEFKKK